MDSDAPRPADTFSILAVFGAVFSELRDNAVALICALVVPSLLMHAVAYGTAGLLAWHGEQSGAFIVVLGLAAGLLNTGVYALFAVNVHRIVLLGPGSLPNRWGLYLSGSVVEYLIYLVGLYVGMTVLVLLGGLVLAVVGGAGGGTAVVWALGIVAALGASYGLARISMVLPAAAVDEDTGFDWAWDLSEGTGVRLPVALACPSLACLLPIFAGYIALFQFLGPEPGAAVVSVLEAPMNLLLTAVMVASLSCSYRALRPVRDGADGPPPPRPESVQRTGSING